jgi:hypothetical protein
LDALAEVDAALLVSADALAPDDVLAAGMVAAAASLLTRLLPRRRRRCLDMDPSLGRFVGCLPRCIGSDRPKLKPSRGDRSDRSRARAVVTHDRRAAGRETSGGKTLLNRHFRRS